MNRRNFISAACAAVAAFVMPKKPANADVAISDNFDSSKVREDLDEFRKKILRESVPLSRITDHVEVEVISGDGQWRVTIVIDGQRHRVKQVRPVVKGVLGSTYFTAPAFIVSSVTLNGMDVKTRCSECDSVGGWCVLFDFDSKGRLITDSEKVHFGKVEIGVGEAIRTRTGYRMDTWDGKTWSNQFHPVADSE